MAGASGLLVANGYPEPRRTRGRPIAVTDAVVKPPAGLDMPTITTLALKLILHASALRAATSPDVMNNTN